MQTSIKKYSKLFEEVMKQENIVVIGNETAIKKNEKIFDSVNNIFQK